MIRFQPDIQWQWFRSLRDGVRVCDYCWLNRRPDPQPPCSPTRSSHPFSQSRLKSRAGCTSESTGHRLSMCSPTLKTAQSTKIATNFLRQTGLTELSEVIHVVTLPQPSHQNADCLNRQGRVHCEGGIRVYMPALVAGGFAFVAGSRCKHTIGQGLHRVFVVHDRCVVH